MATYLFSLGLVPVQSWIAEARRARDLRAGSVFLWWTMAKLLSHLQREYGAEILLPRQDSEAIAALAGLTFSKALGETYGIPNRAAGYLDCGNEADVSEAFRKLRDDILLPAWQMLKKESLTKELPRLAGKVWHDLLRAPVEGYMERTGGGEDCPLSLIWVTQKLPNRGETPEDLKAIERLFANVKRTRPVESWRKLAGPIGKCNQCGRREAIGPESDFTAWQRFHQRLRAERWVERGVRIDAGERLCYVCLTRRLAGYAGNPPFRSTGEVAAYHWQRQIDGDSNLANLFEELKREVKNEEVDYAGGDVYRALHARAAELERLGLVRVATKRKALVQAIEEWNSAHPEEPIAKQPPSYLAVLTFDGDDMGRWIPENFPHGPEQLGDFARRAHEVLEEQGAAIFYLAGDEGLAMLPASSALGASLELRTAFRQIVVGATDTPSLSAGLAFFEQSRPMAGAIRAARSALEAAKGIQGKNSLGTAVETASGSRWQFAAPWGLAWKRIQDAVDLVRQRKLSAGWAYDVERLLGELPLDRWVPERWGDDELRAALLSEVERLFLRRLSSKVGKTPKKRRLWRDLGGPGWWQRRPLGEVPEPQPEQFHLIGFLASHTSGGEAWGGEPEP